MYTLTPLVLPEITIGGLDPSTDATGAAQTRFNSKGAPTLLSYAKLIGENGKAKDGTLRARCNRIRHIKRELMVWVAGLTHPIDLLAYEAAFWRGDAASESIPMATGSYLTIGAFAEIDILKVRGQQVKAAYGNSLRSGKRDDLKVNCILWANQTYGLSLSTDLADKDDAIADALAINEAAWKLWAAAYTKAFYAEHDRLARRAQRQAAKPPTPRTRRKVSIQ